MFKRVKLNRLVVMTLEGSSHRGLRASELYNQIEESNPGIMREERIDGVRGFASIAKTFSEVEYLGKACKLYALRKEV